MRLVLALAAGSALAGCATTYDDYDSGRYRYDGSAWAERRGGGGLRGPGVDILDPWLAETPEGRQIVRSGWRSARRGRVDVRTAERANIWFRRHADADRDLCLTDVEIRSALAQSGYHIAQFRGR
jgi:hypothetical protein